VTSLIGKLAATGSALPLLFFFAGLVLLNAAAWRFDSVAGLAASGVSCLVAEWRIAGTGGG
jgi:hypothetical protein